MHLSALHKVLLLHWKLCYEKENALLKDRLPKNALTVTLICFLGTGQDSHFLKMQYLNVLENTVVILLVRKHTQLKQDQMASVRSHDLGHYYDYYGTH